VTADRSPRPGDVVRLDAAASVQFGGASARTVRVLEVHDWPTCVGWVWLRVRVLHPAAPVGSRVRDVFVQLHGLRPAEPRRRTRTGSRTGHPARGGSAAVPAGRGVAAP
jgi:hypothetical protein